MEAFFGEYECKMDQKGRITLPARLKNQLSEGSNQLWVTRGFEQCLTVYSPAQWEPIYEVISTMNPFNKKERDFQRFFLGGTTDVDLDKTGRFLIPKLQSRYAKLSEEVLLVGMGSRLEVWNPDLYEQKLLRDNDAFSDLAEQFFGDVNLSDDKKGIVVNINQGGDENSMMSSDG